MKVTGKQVVKAKQWFGAVENMQTPKFDSTQLEIVMRTWAQKPVDTPAK